MVKTDAELILQSNNREAGLKDLALILAKHMMEMGMFTSCVNCCEWDSPTELCTKFKQRPPAKIIVSGCEFHSDIPF